MYLLILFLPLISATISGFFGRYLGEEGAGRFSSGVIVGTAAIAWIAWYEVGFCGSPTYIPLGLWIDSGELFVVQYGLMFDSLSTTMLILVTTVSALVHIYSTEYMSHDPHKPRFMAYLSLFTFFMVVLVTADNYAQLFIGWEGVGLCSYLLINFWYTRIQANKAAMKAMIVNRVGDVGLALAMFTLFASISTLDFATVFSLIPYIREESTELLGLEINTVSLIGALILVGAVGKSAQMGLHTWLPDAMEGPTPVSALIHAATMVTAGVFVLIRSSPILEYAPTVLVLITVVGGATAIFAASVGLVQNDIKKVIAYSTCSQLGYMVLACGISNYATSLYHLVNHGFFKALLFLSAGSVIHGVLDEQDMRKYGALINNLPLTYTMILIGSMSLMGFPFLTGFYSKDAILELAFGSYSLDGTWGHWLGSLAAFLTAFYSARLIYLTFLSPPTSRPHDFGLSHESPLAMWFPLLVLGFGSIFFGFLTRDLFMGLGSTFLGNAVFVIKAGVIMDSEFGVPVFIKWVPVLLSVAGGFAGILLLGSNLIPMAKSNLLSSKVFAFLINKWNFDQVYNSFIVKPILWAGHEITYKALDRGLIEVVGPTGISKVVSAATAYMSSKLQSGEVYNYALTVFVSTVVLALLLGAGSA